MESDTRLENLKKKVKLSEDLDLLEKQKRKEKFIEQKFKQNVPQLLQCYCEG